MFPVERHYTVAADNPALQWDGDNLLAIRVYDKDGMGGMGFGMPAVYVRDLIDYLAIDHRFDETTNRCLLTLRNQSDHPQKGTLHIRLEDTNSGTLLEEVDRKINLKGLKERSERISYLTASERIRITLTYTDSYTGKTQRHTLISPYILTPPAADTPHINSPRVFGVRPGSPVLFKIAATGKKPLTYRADNLPAGLTVDPATGIIRGTIQADEHRDYPIRVTVSNALGTDHQNFTIRVGDLIALTPPMGWNSWNCWGGSVTEEKVRSSAQALIDKGLIDYGWTYINIDDVWQAKSRTPDGVLPAGDHFPDIKALGDWLHNHGLKLGIYSSPGTLTCAGELGSYQHEAIDARTYAEWGVDYLKYDWCSYNQVFSLEGDNALSAYMKPYQIMERALRSQPRDIVYSLCQYGMRDVWEWGAAVDGNCWRTTGDIVDTWQSLRDIGFTQYRLYPFAKPGRWNDPDMLIVGKVGWGANLHPTRLNVDEQYLHITLWSLLAAPLLIGCDIAQLDNFTLGLLTNNEVIAVNQDVLGKQAQRVYSQDDIEVFVKPLEDGSRAVGIFNLSTDDKAVSLRWAALGITNISALRDLWRQKNLPLDKTTFKANVPAHGTLFIRVQ
jgi:hypothetical protein